MHDKILEKYQIRKSNQEKKDFIEYIKERLAACDYDLECDVAVETKGKGLFQSRNLIVGDPDTAQVILAAHYDTCALSLIPNLMAPAGVGLFLLCQLLVAVLLLLLTGGIGFAAGLLTSSGEIGYWIFLASLWVLLAQMLFGYRNPHSANDNTSGVLVLTRFLEQLPQEHRDKVCVVFFDNEEKGLLGSDYFAKKHKKARKEALLINFDCVGDGQTVLSLAKKKAREDHNYRAFVEALSSGAQPADVEYLRKNMKPMMFPSDQAHFEKGIGVCAARRSWLGLYVGRLHTPFDTICREENVAYLAKAMVAFVIKI